MEGSTGTVTDGLQEHSGDVNYDRGADGDTLSAIPEAVREVAERTDEEAGRVAEPGTIEVDATEWLMAADEPTEEEVQPVELRINIAAPGEKKKMISWWVVPLPDEEFRKFRNMAQPRRARRGMMPNMGDMNDGRYHLLVVTAATVIPDLRAVAKAKGVSDPAEVVRNRFRHKPGLVAQVSGMISDVSGYSEEDVDIAERTAGNS